jgi:hypothetical protein
MNGLGATISVMTGGQTTMEQTSFCYFPRLNIVENENNSISIGTPVAIGVGIARNTYGNDAEIHLYLICQLFLISISGANRQAKIDTDLQ